MRFLFSQYIIHKEFIMNETITELVSKLRNGGSFATNWKKTTMFTFEHKDGLLTIAPDERRGIIKSILAEVINGIGLTVASSESGNKKFEFTNLSGEDGFANITVANRPLTNGDYNFDTDKVEASTVVHEELRGHIRVLIPDTNIMVLAAGMCSGRRLFVFACHVDYKPSKGAPNKNDAPRSNVDDELDQII